VTTGDEPTGADLTYGAALHELEDLLDDLEAADVDVDVLADRVARGVELIRFCRARLDVVTTDVDAVVAELAALDDDRSTDGSAGTDSRAGNVDPSGDPNGDEDGDA
jgi:exodeoxyribonuclease VII small subunit